MSLPQVAKDLDLTESALRDWVREADGGEGKESAGVLSTAEREELVRLRKEVRHLELTQKAHFPVDFMCQQLGVSRSVMSQRGLAARKRRRFVWWAGP